MAISIFVQIPYQLNSYLWGHTVSISVCTFCFNLIAILNKDIQASLLGTLSYSIPIPISTSTFCFNLITVPYQSLSMALYPTLSSSPPLLNF